MKDPTIDVGVLMSGSYLGAPEHSATSNELMKLILASPAAKLAVDAGGRIRAQYDEKMKHGTVGHHWLVEMAKRDKIAFVPWSLFNKGTRTQLKEAHFDPEDFKYVRTACETESKCLVSHDPDYSDTVCHILRRRLGIAVFGAAGGCERLDSD